MASLAAAAAAAAATPSHPFSFRTPYFPRGSLLSRPQFLAFSYRGAAFVQKGPRRLHRSPFFSVSCSSALSPELKTTLDKVVSTRKVVLFMKGTKDFPQCGFSNTVVQILKSLNVPFEVMNILENEMLRQGLKEYSSWPTFPQLYIDGEFFGGCDITVEAYKNGELQELLEKAINS